MSTLVGLRLADTVVLATDSLTYTYDQPKRIISDAQQKIFEVARGVFYAWSGRTSVGVEQARIAEALATIAARPINIRTFATALNAASSFLLVAEANRLLAEQFRPAISGELPFHVYVLAGMSEGTPGFVVCEFRIKNGEILWNIKSSFRSTDDTPVSYITGDSSLTQLINSPSTWADGLITAGERFVDHLRRVTPDCVGGPTQMVCIEKSGPRWVHQPAWVDSISVENDGIGGLALNYGAALGDDGTGKATVLTNGPLYKDISNKLNLNLSTDFVVSGGVLNQNAVNLAKAYGFNTTNFSTSGGAFVVNQIGVNTLIAGNTFNLGTSVFASSASGPAIEIASSGLTMVDNYTTPANLLTIASTGLSLVHGGNSLTVTASGVGIYGPSGSLTATSGGIAITDGSCSVSISSTQVQMIGPSGSLTATSGGVVIYSVNGSTSNPYASLTSSGLLVQGIGSGSDNIEISLIGAKMEIKNLTESSLVQLNTVGGTAEIIMATNGGNTMNILTATYTSAGAASGLYWGLNINGTIYKIALLYP